MSGKTGNLLHINSLSESFTFSIDTLRLYSYNEYVSELNASVERRSLW